MDFEVMDAQIQELQERLSTLVYGSDERKQCIEEIEKLQTIRSKAMLENIECMKIDSNEKIEMEKIKSDEAKAEAQSKADFKTGILRFIQGILATLAGVFIWGVSLDESERHPITQKATGVFKDIMGFLDRKR